MSPQSGENSGSSRADHEIVVDSENASHDDEGPGSSLLETHDALQEGDQAALHLAPLNDATPALKLGVQGTVESQQAEKATETVAWRDLPRKRQLVVIVLTRLSEPLVQTSLQSYMFYQLKWFDPSLPDSVISSQAGILHASFTAAQLFTAMIWGRVADSSHFGRKTVVLIGLTGTMASCLGFGFSTSFRQALFFRSLGGATNGNVSVLRTMISELVREKKYKRRAFILLPMTFNIGVILGPILGGLLADPASSYPNVFGKVDLFHRFPYALPNLVSACFLFTAALSAWMNLEETLDARAETRDYGIELGRKIASAMFACFSKRRASSAQYEPLASSEGANDGLEMTLNSAATGSSCQVETDEPASTKRRARYTQRLAWRRIFTRNVCTSLLAHSLLAFHVGTFNSLWFVFLSTPVSDPDDPSTPETHLPFRFTGGMGLPPAKVGVAMSILGVIGISLQLFAYPTISERLGTVRCLRLFLLCFPITYLLLPYLSLVPSSSPPPSPKSGLAMWMSITTVLCFQVVGRTFSLPSSTLLVNQCTPHPSVLGTFNGIAQSCTSAARTVGPMLCGYLYGLGLANGVVGAAWWGLSCFAAIGWLTSWVVREGDGHEIWLEGDEEDNETAERKGGPLRV